MAKRTERMPVITLLVGLATSLTGAVLVLHFVFQRMPDMTEMSSIEAAARVLIPHAILLAGLLTSSAGAVYLIRQRVIQQREDDN